MNTSPRTPRWLVIAALAGCVGHGVSSAVEINEPAGKPVVGPLVPPSIQSIPAQVPGAMGIPELPKIADPSMSVSLPVPPAAASPGAPEAAAPTPDEQALPQTDGMGATLEALSPNNAGKVSDEQAEGLAARLLDPRESRSGSIDSTPSEIPTDVASVSAGAPALERPSDRREASRADVSEPGRAALASVKPSLRQELADRYTFSRTYLRQFLWYGITHIVDRQDRNMWPSYHERWRQVQAAHIDVPVTDPRKFFTHMRVIGESGIFYVLGFSARREEAVMQEAHETFRRYLSGPGVGPPEEEALDAFMHRAMGYNKERRAHSNFRKHVRDALLAVSLKPSSEMAAHFDSLMREDTFAKTADYQAGRQQQVLAQFQKAVHDTVAEEDPTAADRVVGAVLLGSFATGSAGPKSDFDLELITANGRNTRMRAFDARIKARWKALGLDVHPIGIHESADPPSKGVVKRIHSGNYIVISPDPAIVYALSQHPGEEPYFTVERDLTWKGRIGRALQYVIVYASTLYADLRDSLPK